MWTRPFGGSSPRVRGRPPRWWLSRVRSRLIPACAGQTATLPRLTGLARAHPRVCGADHSQRAGAAPSRGSSPRVRGRRLLPQLLKLSRGLIPACAGQTLNRRSARIHPRAHPRVCGADGGLQPAEVLVEGSSPRVRGRLRVSGLVVGHGGLIPACAGQTWSRAFRLRDLRAHPRVCGADWPRLYGFFLGRGSSPRVRGRPLLDAVPLDVEGLIPACAGQTGVRVYQPVV